MKFISTLLISFLSFSVFGQFQLLKEITNISFELAPLNEFTQDTILEDLLQATLEQTVSELKMTGASVAINFPSGEVWTGVSGKHTATIDLNPDHAFAIGSVSKTIVSAAILKLSELDKLSLDDTIGQWIVQQNIDPAITIRQCLNHTSGIYNYTNNADLDDDIYSNLDSIYDPLQVIEKYVLEPDFSKGTDFKYSNSNYIIAGLIIEAITEKPCHEAIRELVLDPNGFNEVKLFPQESLNLEMAHLWIDFQDTKVEDFQATGNSLNSVFSSAWTAGAYTATPTDMSLWIKKLVHGEILTEQSMNEMKNHGANGYGLALIEFKFPEGKLVGHNGEIGYNSDVYLLQPFNTSFAVHTNDGTENGDNNSVILNKLLITYLQYLATTSNNDLDKKINLSLYPNPSSEFINIDLEMYPGDFIVEIFDLDGKFISKRHVQKSKHIQIPIDQLQNGGYFLYLTGKEFRNTQFFIKQ